MHSSHQLSALLVRQQQAMPLEQQHSKAAMPLVVQLSNQALLEVVSRVQGLEEDSGALGLLLAALPQLNLLDRQTLACGQCADDVTVTSVHQKCDIDHNRHCACNGTAVNHMYTACLLNKMSVLSLCCTTPLPCSFALLAVLALGQNQRKLIRVICKALPY